MSGYLSNFAKLVLEICREENIMCTPLSDAWAFYLKYRENENYIYGYQFGLNPAVSHALCSDKSTASDVLRLHKIPSVLHVCCMSPVTMEYANPAGNWHTVEDMLSKYGKIVCKDNHGTGGELVFMATTQLEAEHAAQLIFLSAESMAVSPYIPIEEEYRVILLDNQVKLLYSKIRPHLTGDGHSTIVELYGSYVLNSKNKFTGGLPGEDFDRVLKKGQQYPLNWKHNLGQGAHAQILTDYDAYSQVIDLAKKAAAALKASFVSVDIIKAREGYLVLEVNSGVMMEYLSGETPQARQIAKEIYREAILKMMGIPCQ